MKIYYYNKTVRAEAENLADIKLLLSVASNPLLPVSMGGASEEKVEKTKHRKHQHKKPCPECGKLCKGNKGLGTHRSNLHGVRSPLYAFNKAYREQKKQGTPAGILSDAEVSKTLEVKHG